MKVERDQEFNAQYHLYDDYCSSSYFDCNFSLFNKILYLVGVSLSLCT